MAITYPKGSAWRNGGSRPRRGFQAPGSPANDNRPPARVLPFRLPAPAGSALRRGMVFYGLMRKALPELWIAHPPAAQANWTLPGWTVARDCCVTNPTHGSCTNTPIVTVVRGNTNFHGATACHAASFSMGPPESNNVKDTDLTAYGGKPIDLTRGTIRFTWWRDGAISNGHVRNPRFVELPLVRPLWDPLAAPVLAPEPSPNEFPAPFAPTRVQPNPWRAPSERPQRGPVPVPRPRIAPAVRPAVRPQPGVRPAPAPRPALALRPLAYVFGPTGAPRPVPVPRHVMEPPRRRTKERKVVAQGLLRAAGALTEGSEVVWCAFNALPYKTRLAGLSGTKSRGEAVGPKVIKTLFTKFPQMNMDKFFACLGNNQIEDMAIGRVSKATKLPDGRSGLPSGFAAGGDLPHWSDLIPKVF